MSEREQRPNLTPRRREWLVHLLPGPALRPSGIQGRTAYDCMVLQWTRYNWKDKATGADMDGDELRRKYGEDAWGEHAVAAGDRLTELGRQMLAKSGGAS